MYKSYFDPVSGAFWGSSKSDVVKPKWADAIVVEGRYSSDWRINDFDDPIPELIPDDEVLVKSREQITYCYQGDPIGKKGDRWLGIMNLPVKVAGDLVFDFDEFSWKLMRETVENYDFLDSQGKTSHHQWKLAGSQGLIPVTKADLQDYLQQCVQARALNVGQAWPEYQFFKARFDAGDVPTLMELENWKKSYEVI